MNSVVYAHLIMSQKSDTAAILELLTQSRGVVLFVLVLLVAFSIACWGVIVYKWYALYQAQNQSLDFLDLFWGSKRLDNIYQEAEDLTRSPIAQVFRAGYIELNKVQRSAGQSEQTMGHALGGMERLP